MGRTGQKTHKTSNLNTTNCQTTNPQTQAKHTRGQHKPNKQAQTKPNTKEELPQALLITHNWPEANAGDIGRTGQNHAKAGGSTKPTVTQPAPKPKPNTQESSTSQPTKPKQSQTERKDHPKHPSHPTDLRQILGTFARARKPMQLRWV